MVSFDNIDHFSKVIDENEFYKHYYNEQAKYKSDSNFMQLKFQPILEEFQIIEGIHIAFSERTGLDYLKFYWPDNKPFTAEIITYFEDLNYQLEMLELYQIAPENFTSSQSNESVNIQVVTDENLDLFKKINYDQDLKISSSFAKQKETFYDQIFTRSAITFYIAFIDGEAAGGLTLIESEKHFEIDSLFTVEQFQKSGLATEMQKVVMKLAQEKQKDVILLADGEDTPSAMYKKQGYNFISFILGAQYFFI